MMPTVRICAALATLAAMTVSAAAQAPALAGKTVQIIIGFDTGGGFDLWGRAVARHIGKHLPGNPTVVPQNMPAAGGLGAANHIYSIAPKDGTMIGFIAGSAVLGPITGISAARFDPNKIGWLGTPSTETSICVAYNSPNVKVKSVKDLYEQELIVGATGPGNGIYYHPKALSALLGLKFKVIPGFRGSAATFLAMERGEIDGVCNPLDSISNQRPDWIPDKKVAVLFQGGNSPNPALKDVPYVNDLARTAEERQAIEFLYAGSDVGRPFLAPPGLAPEVLAMWRAAFNATMTDPEFLDDAKRQNLAVEPEDGEHVEAIVRRIYATPKPIVDKIGELIK
jgi:tripartite-type tricarboxylate transporter receptor subunit TctC